MVARQALDLQTNDAEFLAYPQATVSESSWSDWADEEVGTTVEPALSQSTRAASGLAKLVLDWEWATAVSSALALIGGESWALLCQKWGLPSEESVCKAPYSPSSDLEFQTFWPSAQEKSEDNRYILEDRYIKDFSTLSL